ncbi:MAG TPA: helical backbone metal receptor, partial [Candidatus Krumholzibacterium sp.]|nr:helical backbone metal receptor [Candidatus Krumholzibacterium sp.]
MAVTRKKTGPGRLFLIAAISLSLLPASCGGGSERSGTRADLTESPRVVSLSPSTTEIMFDLGLGGTLVGVSRFCQLPEGFGDIEKMGGYLDPNYEKIASLRPDVVLLLPEQEGVGRYLSRLGLGTLTIDNKKVEDILAGITKLGEAFGREEAADSIIRSIG